MKKIRPTLLAAIKALTPSCRRYACSGALLLFATAPVVNAFTFSESDMLLGFRQPGGSYEVVVNLGRATNFNRLALLNPGGSVDITNYSATKLSSAFSDFGALNLSVFSSVVTIGQVEPPYGACWATRARSDLGVRTETWKRRLALSQGSAAVTMNSVGTGALLVPGASGSDTEVTIDAGSAVGYAARVGALGDFGGRWQGSLEGVTPSDFVSSQLMLRLDLYYVAPDPTNKKLPGQYLGFFDFKWDGTMKFTAGFATAVLTRITPTEGGVLGGAVVTLTGSGFRSGDTVMFGGAPSPQVTVTSASELIAVAPAHSVGLVDVVVASLEGQISTLAQAFSYVEEGLPPSISILETSLRGADLVLLSAGATNGISWVLTSNDLSKPFVEWTTLMTNHVGADGLFTNTLSVSSMEPARFYRLSVP